MPVVYDPDEILTLEDLKKLEFLEESEEYDTSSEEEEPKETFESLTTDLQNLDGVMEVLNRSLKAVSARFTAMKKPNRILVAEYQDLILKMHNFDNKRQALVDKLRPYQEPPEPPAPPAADESIEAQSNEDDSINRKPKFFLRAHLPNQQRTSVQIVPGLRLCDALMKALSRRNLTCNMCEVTTLTNEKPIPWDTDISKIRDDEIYVKVINNLPVMSHISHTFIRKTFFKPEFCECCRRLLYTGIVCSQCKFKFHAKCAKSVPSMCHEVHLDTYYKLLLSTSPKSPSQLLDSQENLSSSTLCQKDRSNSVPNINTISELSSDLPAYMNEIQARQNSRLRSDDCKKNSVYSNENWNINAEEVIVGPFIGSGSFGKVYRARWHGDVAVKILKIITKNRSPEHLKAFTNEVAMLKKTRHCNIVLFIGCVSEPSLAIITQWCDGDSLYTHIHKQNKRFKISTIIGIAKQTAQGMGYLHGNGIIHRDLKSQNIFLSDKYSVKIGDFGLATAKTRWTADKPETGSPNGSIYWMAPEVIRMRDPNPYSYFSDVYSFGIVLYELLTRSLPYNQCNDKHKDALLWKIARGILRPDLTNIRSDCPYEIKRMTNDCIKLNREERPLFTLILNTLETMHMLQTMPKIRRVGSDPNLRTFLKINDF